MLLKTAVAIEPIIANLFAIGIAIGLLVILNHPTLLPALGKYQKYLTYVMYGLIVLQTIRSARFSLLIPLLALTVASIGFFILGNHPHEVFFNVEELRKLMLLGVVGLAVSVLAIR
jgi:hypothetical protein